MDEPLRHGAGPISFEVVVVVVVGKSRVKIRASSEDVVLRIE